MSIKLLLLLFSCVVLANFITSSSAAVPIGDAQKQVGLYGADPYKQLFDFLDRVDNFLREINYKIHEYYSVKNWFENKVGVTSVVRAFKTVKSKVLTTLGLKKEKTPFSLTSTDHFEMYKEAREQGCPGVYYQAYVGAPYVPIPLVFLKDAFEIDFEGVLARSCLSLEDQKKFLFAEYKFNVSSAGVSVISNDKVPLMSYVARQGARRHRQLELRKPNASGCAGEAVKECLDATRAVSVAELAAKFPWAAPYIQQNCSWVFNTAGQGYAHLCYVYGSITENVVFWGSPIGNQGFSGSYDSKVWDHMLAGIMETFEAGHIPRLTQYPGQFHLLNRWSGNYYRINRDCYMLDYLQGNVAQSMRFAIIVPTKYTTMDYRSAMKAVCQYATLVINVLDGQNVFPDTLGKIVKRLWLDLIGAKGDTLDSSDGCAFADGIDPFAKPNMEGAILTDEEANDFHLTTLPCDQEIDLIDSLKSAFHGNDDSKKRAKEVKKQLQALQQSTRYLEAKCPPPVDAASLAEFLKVIH